MTAPSVHDFIRELEAHGRQFTLTSVREGAVMVQVAVPGERWEIEFFEDRDPEVEVFRSGGEIVGLEAFFHLLRATG